MGQCRRDEVQGCQNQDPFKIDLDGMLCATTRHLDVSWSLGL